MRVDIVGNIITQGCAMAEDLNKHFSSVFATFTLSGYFTVIFLPNLAVSAVLSKLFTDPMA